MLEWNSKYRDIEPEHLWVHQDYEPVFRERGWTTSAALMQASFSCPLGRRRDYKWRRGWDNVRFISPVPDQSGKELSLFMKRHRDFWHWTDSAFREALIGVALDSASVPCMKIVACGKTQTPIPDGEGRWFTSLFLSEPIGTGVSAIEGTRQALAKGKQGESDLLRIIDAVAMTVARMHSTHIYHGDCHLGNFILDPQASGAVLARVIDFQSSRLVTPALALRVWLHDMCLLRSWWIRLGVDFGLHDYWYERYLHWAESPHLHRWMKWGGRRLISLQGDFIIVRRGFSRFRQFQFAQGFEILRQRYRPAA